MLQRPECGISHRIISVIANFIIAYLEKQLCNKTPRERGDKDRMEKKHKNGITISFMASKLCLCAHFRISVFSIPSLRQHP